MNDIARLYGQRIGNQQVLYGIGPGAEVRDRPCPAVGVIDQPALVAQFDPPGIVGAVVHLRPHGVANPPGSILVVLRLQLYSRLPDGPGGIAAV